MSEQELKAQEAGQEPIPPVIIMAAGLVVWLITIVVSLASPSWGSHTGLLANNASIAVLTGWGAGSLLFLYGWLGWTWGLAADKPDPLGGIERELAGLRQEVAALRAHLTGGP